MGVLVVGVTPQMKDQRAWRTGSDVVVVQLWTGFARQRAAVVTIINGRKRNMRAGTVKTMQHAFDVLSHPTAGRITDADARAYLSNQGVRQQLCGVDGCTAVLPIGELWCGMCGAAHAARQ
jgi:hypothetical protein